MMDMMNSNPVIDVSEHADDAASEVSSLSASYRSGYRILDHQIGAFADNSNFTQHHQDENDCNIESTRRTAQHQLEATAATAAETRMHQLFDKHDRRVKESNFTGAMIDSSLDVDDIFGLETSATAPEGRNNRNDDRIGSMGSSTGNGIVCGRRIPISCAFVFL